MPNLETKFLAFEFDKLSFYAGPRCEDSQMIASSRSYCIQNEIFLFDSRSHPVPLNDLNSFSGVKPESNSSQSACLNCSNKHDFLSITKQLPTVNDLV